MTLVDFEVLPRVKAIIRKTFESGCRGVESMFMITPAGNRRSGCGHTSESGEIS
jgi:hypothetical protein